MFAAAGSVTHGVTFWHSIAATHATTRVSAMTICGSVFLPLLLRGHNSRCLQLPGQVIKKWYAELPDKLGKALANQKKSDKTKSDEEMQAAADRQEEKYLLKEGWSKDDIEEAVPYEEDPVVAGT